MALVDIFAEVVETERKYSLFSNNSQLNRMVSRAGGADLDSSVGLIVWLRNPKLGTV